MAATQTLTPSRTITAQRPAAMEPRLLHRIADDIRRERPDPFRFDPDRFLREREAALPRGAYIPFGGGSRMCLGKRFGEYELRALAAVLLTRVRFEPLTPEQARIATTPTLGPKGGLRFRVVGR